MVRDGEASPSSSPQLPRTLLLLGAGEIGKELAISAQRLGLRVVAADRYEGAPAMSVAHTHEVLDLLDETALEGVIRTHRPDLILPEVEAIGTDTLLGLEEEGFRVLPNAAAAALVADRTTLREMARSLAIRTPAARAAGTLAELREGCDEVGYPVVVKPARSSSGRGHSHITGPSRVERAWQFAREEIGSAFRGLVVEEFIDFHTEVTLVGVRDASGGNTFLPPIAHRQDRGGFRESWTPAGLSEAQEAELHEMAVPVMDRLGGPGVIGLEFLLGKEGAVFSELSLGPHDTGMVTMVSQDLSQFDLHIRAILGLPVGPVRTLGPSACAVILADRDGKVGGYAGIDRALQIETAQVRIFGKPEAHPYRRMGVALATGHTVEEARERALEAAARVRIEYL